MKRRVIGRPAVTGGFAVLAAMVLLLGVAVGTARAGTTERVSVASDGTHGNDGSYRPSISADGRFVAFYSYATNLVERDTNGYRDIFVYDRQAGQTTRVSVASDGTQGNGDSGLYGLSISADGRFVAFYSEASNLVADDTNGTADSFVHDRQTSQTTRVSVASDGAQANNSSRYPFISADGRFVAFDSQAGNLVADDTNGKRDAFVHDRQTGQTTRVSVASDGTQGNERSSYPSISADGRFVAFSSGAGNLVAGDTNGWTDVFIHDRQTGQTTRVNIASDGAQGNAGSGSARISTDGRLVAFRSTAGNLVAGDTNGVADIFVYDRQTSETTRVSVASEGTEARNHASWRPSISADGRFVAFYSHAKNLVEDDTNETWDIFVHDRQTGQTTRVSVATDGTQGNNVSVDPSISDDGRFVAFRSGATNLVAGDTNGYNDVFVHDRSAATVALTVTTSGSGAGTVELSPPGGVYDHGTTVTLTAHASAGSIFDHWEGDLSGSDNPATMLMDDHQNVAAYFILQPTLTVQSTPITGVNITGDKPGTTNYTATCDDQEVVSLTAPPTATDGSVRYSFVRWTGQPDGQATIGLTMNADRTATAVYAAAPQRLIIEGPDQRGEGPAMMGEGTVTVDVYAEGITGFAAVQAVLEFADPLGADDAFLISTTDGNPEFGGQAIVYNEALFGSIFSIYVGVVGRPFYRQTAGFMMSSGNADLPGKAWLMSITYDFDVGYDTVGTHTITANELLTVLAGTGGGIPYEVVPGSATFVAWPIPGDANLDCVINVIDMLVIRDKLGADVSSGDNWRADVNEDGAIDVLDLLFVRGKLHDVCALSLPRTSSTQGMTGPGPCQ